MINTKQAYECLCDINQQPNKDNWPRGIIDQLSAAELIDRKPLTEYEYLVSSKGFEFIKTYETQESPQLGETRLKTQRAASVLGFELELKELIAEHMETDLTITEAVGTLHLCAAEITHQFFNKR